MSSPVPKKFKENTKQQSTNCIFSCCDDNNIQTSNNYQFKTNRNINANSPKQARCGSNTKLELKLARKYMSPNSKNTNEDKIHLKDQKDKLRSYIKSLQQRKQQTEDIPSPRKYEHKKNNKVTVNSIKRSEMLSKPSGIKYNEAVKNKNNNINEQTFRVLKSESNIYKNNQKKLQNERVMGQNQTFFSHFANNNQRPNTAFYNPQANFSFSNKQQSNIKNFSPPTRFLYSSEALQLGKTSENIQKYIETSPMGGKFNNFTHSSKVSSPIFNQFDKSTQNMQQYKQSTNKLKNKIKDEKTFARQASDQNHLTMTSDEDSKTTEQNITNGLKPFEKIAQTQGQIKRQQFLQVPQKIMELDTVKHSVISQMKEQKKDNQTFFGLNTKIVNRNNVFTTILNPESDSTINVSYGTSYNPSLVFQSYKQPAHRYLLGNLSSATVNSIMEPIRDSQIKQKVEQSVVMLDFFNSPQYERQLQ